MRKLPLTEAHGRRAVEAIARAHAEINTALAILSGRVSVKPIDKLIRLVNTMSHAVDGELDKRCGHVDWMQVIAEAREQHTARVQRVRDEMLEGRRT